MDRSDAPSCCPLPDPEFLQALADDRRLILLGRLACAGAPLTVSEAAECCGVHVSGASRHLSILRRAGIVRAERDGREVRYTLETRSTVRVLRDLIRFLKNKPA